MSSRVPSYELVRDHEHVIEHRCQVRRRSDFCGSKVSSASASIKTKDCQHRGAPGKNECSSLISTHGTNSCRTRSGIRNQIASATRVPTKQVHSACRTPKCRTASPVKVTTSIRSSARQRISTDSAPSEKSVRAQFLEEHCKNPNHIHSSESKALLPRRKAIVRNKARECLGGSRECLGGSRECSGSSIECSISSRDGPIVTRECSISTSDNFEVGTHSSHSQISDRSMLTPDVQQYDEPDETAGNSLNAQFLPVSSFLENVFKPQYYFTFLCNVGVHTFTQTAAATIFVTFWLTTFGVAFPPMLPVILPHAFLQAGVVSAICCRSYLLEFMESYIAYILVTPGGFLFSTRAAFSWRFWLKNMPTFLWRYFTFWGFYISLLLFTFIPYLGPLLVLVLNAKATGTVYYSKAQSYEMTEQQVRRKSLDLFMFGGTAFLLEWLPFVGGIAYSTNLAAARKLVGSDLGLEEIPPFSAINASISTSVDVGS
ncbi:HBL056Cp [Eremothecium sinecaudum]|uniref:HBL056Cp n=1 Tax=Eremothecium sinecaudum TaxID=45286 RepID=A0A125RDX5_9SACH|nr:HBL056Cp [Eremothecium sinecaudum]AMD18846.1 HBL056Cp [Eremothecium sinecaudum]